MQHIRDLWRSGFITNTNEEHLQPSSVDLSISGEVYRMRGTFLPRPNEHIRDILKEGVLFETSLDQPLELNGIYLIRLNESLRLPNEIFASTNNKSSSGRVNLQTRLLVNRSSSFDFVPRGYHGELWLEVIPKSFPVKLSEGERLNQMRFFTEDARLTEREYQFNNGRYGFLRDAQGNVLPQSDVITKRGVTMSIDLECDDVIGYKCSPTTSRVLDYSRRDYNPLEFFEPIPRPRDGQFVMKKDEFYIFVTQEGIRVPPELAVEMAPYDVSKGEFRSHYAGFFDPGWGYGKDGETLGTPAVLEVFTHDNDFILRHGQPICQMVYEILTSPAEVVYGDQSLVNHYYRQTGPRLSKHFKVEPDEPASDV